MMRLALSSLSLILWSVEVEQGPLPLANLTLALELQVKGRKLLNGETEGEDGIVYKSRAGLVKAMYTHIAMERRFRVMLTWILFDVLQVLLDQDGTAKGALCEFAVRVSFGIQRLCASFFLDADEHLGKEKALQFLPRLTISAHAKSAVKS